MNQPLTCCIIDDEPLAQQILATYIAKVPFLILKGSFSSPLEATGFLRADKPDLLFLDINMPNLDGLSFIPMLSPRPLVVLTTAYEQYALKAYELEVKDYLLKPFSFERFYQGVLRLYHDHCQRLPPPERAAGPLPAPPPQAYLFLKVGHRLQKVAIADILFIEGMKDYLRLYTPQENVMTLLSFAKLEEQLPVASFARVHKSFMVALDKIDHIEKNRIRIADHLIPISDTFNEQFFAQLKRFQ
ncbi:LytR/AlgR family response regulator transcription factor [Hymenobacter arizonensis]|uniref:DNA-binding response regulator, LytR/AlgR family n=1 Tax=Hymenobacter arizonensis TaxID=1227077 RepID=A0A1I6BIV2_HYMAR|nr:response regulator transcription factor [Hymenobacter arizonensis]SFQ80870.1 DNA-binding response regulator, LytR/AlgR family [Hymenobacter arizonensis]